MIRIVGDTGKGCSDNQYRQFNVAAFAGPQTGSLGLESGRNYMAGCPDHTLDLSIARNIRLGGARQLQLRVDAFNALNTVVYNGRVTQRAVEQPDRSDGAQRAVSAERAGRSESPDAAQRRVRRRHRRQAMRSIQGQIRFSF